MNAALNWKGVSPMQEPDFMHYVQANPAFQALDFFAHCHAVMQRENILFLDRVVKKSFKKPAEWNSLFSEKFDYEYYEMTPEELREYNMEQIKEIQKYQQYLEESHCPCSMEDAIRQWSEKYSASFRKYWHLKKLTEFF